MWVNGRWINESHDLVVAPQGDQGAAAFVGALAGTLIAALASQNPVQPAQNEHLLLHQQQNALLQQQNAALIEALKHARPPATGGELVRRKR